MTQPEARNLVLQLIDIVYEAIRDSNGLPSGQLYTMLMPMNIGIDGYNALITIMMRAGKIYKIGHCLYAVKGGQPC